MQLLSRNLHSYNLSRLDAVPTIIRGRTGGSSVGLELAGHCRLRRRTLGLPSPGTGLPSADRDTFSSVGGRRASASNPETHMKISLVVAQGVHTGKVIPVTAAEFVIGRDPQCHLRPASPYTRPRTRSYSSQSAEVRCWP